VKILEHLTPEQNIVQVMLMRIFSSAKPLGEFATWLLTGVAIILGAILVNVDAVSNILSPQSLRWGLALLVGSLLCGVVTKLYSVALMAGITLTEELYDDLASPEAKAIIYEAAKSSAYVKSEIISAFLPPLRGLLGRGYDRGTMDAISGVKRMGKTFSILLIAFWLQSILGTLGLLVLGLGI